MKRFNGTKLSMGNIDLISGSDGYNGAIQHIGNFDFFSDNRGNHGAVTHIGDFDFFDFNGLSGDILHIGGGISAGRGNEVFTKKGHLP